MKTMRYLVVLLSIVLTGFSTAMWWKYQQSGTPLPLYLLGMLSYGWVFMLFLIINRISASIKRQFRGK